MTIDELNAIKVGTKIQVTHDGGQTWGPIMTVYKVCPPTERGAELIQGYAKGGTRDMFFAACETENSEIYVRLAPRKPRTRKGA